MKIVLNKEVLFSIISKEEEVMMEVLYDYLDYMFFVN